MAAKNIARQTFESDNRQVNWIEVPECPVQLAVISTPNSARFNRPIRKSTGQAEKVLVTIHAIKMRINKGVKKIVEQNASMCHHVQYEFEPIV
jgi:hypothetical protein